MPTTNTMSVMNDDGDLSVSWDPANPDSVAVASETFATYSGRGYRAYAMSSGTEGAVMSVFDPTAASILLVPQMRGG